MKCKTCCKTFETWQTFNIVGNNQALLPDFRDRGFPNEASCVFGFVLMYHLIQHLMKYNDFCQLIMEKYLKF